MKQDNKKKQIKEKIKQKRIQKELKRKNKLINVIEGKDLCEVKQNKNFELSQQKTYILNKYQLKKLENADYFNINKGLTMYSSDQNQQKKCFCFIVNLRTSLISLLQDWNEKLIKIIDLENIFAKLSQKIQIEIRNYQFFSMESITKFIKKVSYKPVNDEEINLKFLQYITFIDQLYFELLVKVLTSGKSMINQLPLPNEYLRLFQQNSLKESIFSIYELSTENISHNPLFEYLSLKISESQNINLQNLFQSSIKVEGLQQGKLEGTMRGTDPLVSPSIRDFWDSQRDRVCQIYAFAVPNKAAAEAFQRHQNEGVIEIGAGTGYWANYLQKNNVKIEAFDIKPPQNQVLNDYHGNLPMHFNVKKGQPENVLSENQQQKLLFLCYPPPDSKMAQKSVELFSGNKLALVGEISGDTGTCQFEQILNEKWTLIEEIIIPNFGNTCYSLTFWKKGKQVNNKIWPLCCSCGVYPNNLNGQKIFRCRQTRAVIACSKKCTQSQKTLENVQNQKQMRFLGLQQFDFEQNWRKYKLI